MLIYIIMFGMFFGGLFLVYLLTKFGNDFRNAAKQLRTSKERETQIRVYLAGTSNTSAPLFQNQTLQQTFEEYRSTYQRMLNMKGDAPFVEITDFFNSDYLDEISHTSICDLTSGTMTGLGILGTFIGLVAGISGFDTTTATALTSSVSGLLGGMNTAFTTSIVGIILSLVYSYIQKSSYEYTNKNLNNFVTVFHDKNLDGAENNAEKQLLRYQKQQTELMKDFASIVSDAVSDSIGTVMKSELVPIFNQMKDTIDEFGKLASRQQKDGLDQIVQEFIRCMNESLKGQFDRLSVTIGELCDWQKASMEQMQKVVDGICNTSNEIEKINESSRQTIAEMNAFVTLMKQYQDKIHAEAELIEQRMQISNVISSRQADYIDKLIESETRIADLSDSIKKEAEIAQQTLDSLSSHCKEQIEGITTAAKQSIDEVSSATKVLMESSQSQLASLAQAATSEMQLLSETASNLSEENNKQLLALTTASSDQIAAISEAADRIVENSQKQIASTLDAAQSQSSAMRQVATEFAQFVRQEQDKLVESISKEVSGLSDFTDQTTGELKDATISMENAAKLLDKNLDDVLNRTFTSFDSGLADISQHLSGTIADVRDTTERLPNVIRDTQKQYEAVFAQLTEQTQRYLTAMENLTLLINSSIPSPTNEEGNRQ